MALPITVRPVVAFLAMILPVVLGALAGCAPRALPLDAAMSAPQWTREALHMPDGAELPLHAWAPPDGAAPEAVVIGAHGFNDYGHAFAAPGAWLAEAKNIQVYAYDQRGFGESPSPGLWPGVPALTRDLGTVVRLIRTRHPDVPVYLLGVSMGGAVIMAAAETGTLPPVDGVILAAPAVWGRATMPFYQRWALWLAARTVPWMTFTGEGLGRWPTDNREVLRQLSRDPKVLKETRVDAMHGLTNLMDTALHAGDSLPRPALVMYGANDEIVPPQPMRRLWRDLDDARGVSLAYYEDGWHMLLRDKQAKAVWRDLAAWIAAPDQGLPSDADDRALPRLKQSIP